VKTAFASFVFALPTCLALLFPDQFRDGPPFLIVVFLPVAAILGFFGLGLAAFATDIPRSQRRVIGLLSLPAWVAVAISAYIYIGSSLAG
jgi:hypothetical protein